MRCLCCNKEIKEQNSTGWHLSCIKKFFKANKLPIIDISKEKLELLAVENVKKGFTVPGVQTKLSLHLSKEDDPRLTLINYPTGYILKPQTPEYSMLPECEFLVMQMANATKIKTVPFALIKIDSTDEFAYLTKRIDRVNDEALAMEDFCQLENRLTADKYKGSYERCAKVIMKYSVNPGMDVAELFLRVVFSYVVGNSDMHLKNFSLIETFVNSQEYILSPAYDMLPVSIILPEDDEALALTLNGKKKNIRRNDFLVFAESIGLTISQAKKMIDKIISLKDIYLSMCRDSYLSDELKTRMQLLIEERIGLLTKKELK